MARRSASSFSYDADPRLSQGGLVLATLVLILVVGIALIVRGLT